MEVVERRGVHVPHVRSRYLRLDDEKAVHRARANGREPIGGALGVLRRTLSAERTEAEGWQKA